MRRTSRRRALGIVFALAAGWLALVAWLAATLVGDGEVDWLEIAARAALGGVLALMVAAVIPPKRLQAVQRPLSGAIYRGRLPRDVDPELWRAALEHHRGALWVWRWLLPLLLGVSAVVCAVATFFLSGGPLGAVLGIGLFLAGVAAGSRIYAERRGATLDDLLVQLDERAG
ncbi:hypothetical protein [Blastococcus litoris]|uniref:hypothetical protein n=1 Tax=Blastococcus litoris TaxID=2171622 RepID=UPI000E3081A0|nr:hypothetical protein [Blastococcus litoris]